jgi:hypothetical protein
MTKPIKLTIAIVVLAILAAAYVWHSNSTHRYVRHEVHSPEAKRDLEALDKALKIMRAKDCSDPLSWYYQGAIHWIPDTIADNKLCESYHTVADLKEAWDNCTHSPSGKEKLHFLVWHRLYIWHFEKIVRKLSGYNKFTLPYWDYSGPNSNNKVLQEMFRTPGTGVYEACRYDELNAGQPISGEIERALDLTNLMKKTDYKDFCYQINAAPHGAMHDYIGAGNDTTGTLKFNNPITNSITNTGLMGWVPTAGFDPVFWTHHSQIDRIWQQWTNSENGKLVTLEELKEVEWPYVFFDENGKKITYTLEQALDIIYKMDYDFDDVKVQPKVSSPRVSSYPETVLATSAEPIKINSQITDAVTQLKLTGDHPKTIKLVLTVSYTKMPHGVYEVYLNNQNEFSTSDNEFVGYMTFFGTDHKMSGESCPKGCCTPLTKAGRPTFVFEYNIPYSHTNKIQIYKHNGKHTGDLVIEKIEFKK